MIRFDAIRPGDMVTSISREGEPIFKVPDRHVNNLVAWVTRPELALVVALVNGWALLVRQEPRRILVGYAMAEFLERAWQ